MREIRSWLMDMDGVLVHEEQAIPGAAEFLAQLREREIPFERGPGVRRVLVVGDSQVAGFEVAEDETFTRVAERELRAQGIPIEIINAGFRGYGTDQVLLFVQDEGLRYRPDLVVYVWAYNDPEDNMTVHRPFRRFGKG